MDRPRFFLPSEVAAHRTAADIWVSFLGRVLDLSPLVSRFQGQRVALVTMAMYGLWWIFCRTSSAQGPCVPAGDLLLLPILECAGQDISCWFDATTGDVLRWVDPRTGCVRFCTPRGRFLHVPPEDPRSDWDTDIGEPWWRDPRLEVGLLTSKSRWIRIINTLTSQEQLLEVCSEETLEEILQRYLRYNSHAHSYTWKFDGAVLDMKKTLSENGLPDEDLELDQLRLDRDAFVPAVLLHFNDDLTEG